MTDRKTWPKAMAACNAHLAELLGEAVAAGTTETARVSHLKEPDEAFVCSCGASAHWYIRTMS